MSKTLTDWLKEAEARHLELINGELVEKAAPDAPHANAQSGANFSLRGPFHRGSGIGGPGGWWILTEADVQLSLDVFRPDIAGWRRETCPELPGGWPIQQRPDWICEIISTSNRARDTVVKQRLYYQAGVPHYWLLDPSAGTLTVYRHAPGGYLQVVSAQRGENVRPEPFDAVELSVGVLLGDDPP
jgi:Uma2 family endonuclease